MSEEDEDVAVDPSFCRHCGKLKHVATFKNQATLIEKPYEEGDDWLCAECDHWQDQTLCPTCNQITRISLLPAEFAPKVARPQR